jgi:hypothetical protein
MGSMAEPGACDQMRDRIAVAQKEFEQLWLAISSGTGGDRARFRELRGQLAVMRDEYRRDCGELVETSELPRSVTADWRAG